MPMICLNTGHVAHYHHNRYHQHHHCHHVRHLPGSRQRLNLSHQPERSHSTQVFPHQGNNLAHQSLRNLEDLWWYSSPPQISKPTSPLVTTRPNGICPFSLSETPTTAQSITNGCRRTTWTILGWELDLWYLSISDPGWFQGDGTLYKW